MLLGITGANWFANLGTAPGSVQRFSGQPRILTPLRRPNPPIRRHPGSLPAPGLARQLEPPPHCPQTPTPLKRAVLPLLLATWFAMTLAFPASAAGLEQHRLFNREYVRLAEWAALRGLQFTRTPGSREVLLTGPSTRIALQVDGMRAEVNRVALWLSYPVVASENQVYITSQDARGVLDALLQPHRLPPGRRIRTICLDPGHGGKEPGQKSGTRLEKKYTLLLAQEVKALLVAAGFNVILTRRDDSYVDFPERTAIARRGGADLFVSLHYNASPDGGGDAGGVEVYAMTPEGARSTNVSNDVGSLKAWTGNETDAENVLLAYQLQKSLLQRLPGTEDRGVRRARFMVLRLAEMPAVLIEGGFMSNSSDARWIFADAGRRKMAQAIVEGIQGYRRQLERPVVTPTPAPSKTPPQRSSSSTSSSSSARPDSATN